MAKIPFDIKFRPQIESGEYKVETRDGKPARILCWDKVDEYGQYIVALVQYTSEHENMISVYEDGIYKGTYGHGYDLFIITPEPEMTAFEKKVYAYCDGKTVGEELIKRIAKELLDLAGKEFIKQGYIIEKKAFHDAVKNVAPEVKSKVSATIDFANFVHDLGERYPEVSFAKLTRIAKAAYDYSKQEALKDLPRWKKLPDGIMKQVRLMDKAIIVNHHYILFSDLEKLPGFKENSHE